MPRGEELTLGRLEAMGVTALSVPALVAGFLAAEALAGRLHPDLGSTPPGASVALPFLAGIAVTFVLHELAHAAAFRALGARPRVGVMRRGGLPYIYVSAPGHPFTRGRFLAAGTAPLVLLDALGLALVALPGIWSLGVAMVAVNTAGAVGDLWLCGRLLREPPGARWEAADGRFYAWRPPG